MRYTLSAIPFDPLGYVEMEGGAGSQHRDFGRRNSRVATLDGGATLSDGGFADADRDITVSLRPSPAVQSAIQTMFRLYARVRMTTPEGVFIVAPGTYRSGGDGTANITFLVLEKESA